MDYEKAYKESFEAAKGLHEAGNALTKKQMEIVFPQLAESEDERMIKALETFINQPEIADKITFEARTGWLAWLEKQKAKEQYDRMAPIYNNLDSFESALGKAWKSYNDTGARTVDGCEDNYVECAHAKGFREGFLFGIEKQKEQKPVEWKPQPESLEALMYAIEGKWEMIKPTSYLSRRLEDLYEGIVNTYNVNEAYLEELPKVASTGDIEGLKALKRKIDASMDEKPAEWSEEDERMMRSALWHVKNSCGNGGKSSGEYEIYHWLESLPKRFNLEPKQKWSKKDYHWEGLIQLLRDYQRTIDRKSNNVAYEDVECYISWLKSIRSSWKPSEEQMDALRDVIETVPMTCRQQVPLELLYADLKKLM